MGSFVKSPCLPEDRWSVKAVRKFTELILGSGENNSYSKKGLSPNFFRGILIGEKMA